MFKCPHISQKSGNFLSVVIKFDALSCINYEIASDNGFFHRSYFIFATRISSFRRGKVFTRVCQSVCPRVHM